MHTFLVFTFFVGMLCWGIILVWPSISRWADRVEVEMNREITTESINAAVEAVHSWFDRRSAVPIQGYCAIDEFMERNLCEMYTRNPKVDKCEVTRAITNLYHRLLRENDLTITTTYDIIA